jgi:hypothetical protein
MTTSTRRASFKRAIAIGIAAAIGAGTAGPCWAAVIPSNNSAETGWQSELVNRPGCWNEGGYDNRIACQTAGGN